MISNCKNQDKKSCNWFILIYEDSVMPEYQETLKSLGIKCAISPCHDSDLGKDGQPLKPHRHILITFSGGRRVKDIDSIIQSINAYQHCEVVYDRSLAYKYLYHGDSPEKALYKQEDIIHINCSPYDFTNSAFKDILNYIDDNNVSSLKSLTRRLRQDDNDNLLEYVSSNCYYIQAYLKDVLWEREQALKTKYIALTSIIEDMNLYGYVQSEKVQKLIELFGGCDIVLDDDR